MTTSNIAMIPLRLGSKRVPKKNLRILKGKPLCFYIIEAVLHSGYFESSNIFINSESDLFSDIANHFGISFYKRPSQLSSDNATNDDFLLDFLENRHCNRIFQFLATSPLLSPESIAKFCSKSENFDVYISSIEHQIECIFNDQAVNFSFLEQTPPSQFLKPVSSYACGMMAWDVDVFKNNYSQLNAGYHGGSSNRGFFPISGIESIDIDKEEDFALAELAIENKQKRAYIEPPEIRYWDGQFTSDEVHVPEILEKDGVKTSLFDSENKLVVNLDHVIESNSSESSWIYRAINTNSNSACLISQLPGEGNRYHRHPDWDEFWYILKGDWLFNIAGSDHKVSTGDLVLIPRNTFHQITAIGTESAIRMAVSRQDVVHSYPIAPNA